ncbi:AAA family ATPase [Mycobacterium sp. smrl_JER01]|uniref:AAA family ATPase n=1 Tax=Mycobacterium sp. smrl_JER01 TaxID=3402633 RepID=UPI003AC4E93B
MKKNTKVDGPRAAQLTELLAGTPAPDDHDGVREYLHRAAGLGCAPLLVMPGTKQPADMRTVRTRNADDKAAQQAAKDAGRSNWAKVKSPAGVHLATADTAVLDGYLDEYIRHYSTWVHVLPDGSHGTDAGVPTAKQIKEGLVAINEPAAVNIAIEVGASRMVVVDCDTAEQLAAFVGRAGAPRGTEPTVRSPGQRDLRTGEMVHKDGGHFYFTVPDGVELPSNLGTFKAPDNQGGYAVLWGRSRYVLAPPSVRPEGPYQATGGVHVAPAWLLDDIAAGAQVHADRAAQRRGHAHASGDKITAWGAAMTWAEILAPTDWVNTGKADSCGCDIWTAPGPHASPKSATAHEPGCGVIQSDDPVLVVWTDGDITPFDAVAVPTGDGQRAVTRLRAWAAIHHNDDDGAAMTALNLHPDTSALGFGDPVAEGEPGRTDSATQPGQAAGQRALRVTWACEIEPEPVVWLWVDISMRNTAGLAPEGTTAPDPFSVVDIACVVPGHTWTPPEVETNGRIACGMVSIAAGREGSGKSSFGIWLASKVTRGTLPGAHYGVPKHVYYLATEDSWKHTLVPRLMAAGADLTKIARVEVKVNEGATVTISLPDDVDLLTRSIIDHDVALVVVDPLMSTLGSGLDANASRDVRTALEPLAAMADHTGASVVAIAHFNKATGLDSLSRITGSGAFKDVARAVMVFADGGDERVFTQPKNSVGRNDLPSLAYKISGEVVDTPKGKTSTGKFTFTGLADRTVDDMLHDERKRGRGKSDVTAFLVDYLTEHADEQTGEVAAADVITAAEGKGFTENQIKHARRRCADPKISTRREGFGDGGKTFWKIERQTR